MTDKLMYTPNDDTQNYSFFRLQFFVEAFGHSNEPIKQNSIKVSQGIRKRYYYKTLGTSVLNSTLSSLFFRITLLYNPL